MVLLTWKPAFGRGIQESEFKVSTGYKRLYLKTDKNKLRKKNQFETSLILSLHRVINPRENVSQDQMGMDSVNGRNSSHLGRGRLH